jgi:hypothetical protein
MRLTSGHGALLDTHLPQLPSAMVQASSLSLRHVRRTLCILGLDIVSWVREDHRRK